MNTKPHAIPIVDNILHSVPPLNNEGNIDYEQFNGWDAKYSQDILLLNLELMSKSTDYLVLHLLAYIIENMELSFISNNKISFAKIIKEAMSHKCGRANFYFFQEFIQLIENEEDVIFYFEMLKISDMQVQNKAISLLLYADIPVLKKFHDFFPNEGFQAFFKKQFSFEDFLDFRLGEIGKKIYFTGLNKIGISKMQIIEIANEKSNYNLMDYIYIYLR